MKDSPIFRGWERSRKTSQTIKKDREETCLSLNSTHDNMEQWCCLLFDQCDVMDLTKWKNAWWLLFQSYITYKPKKKKIKRRNLEWTFNFFPWFNCMTKLLSLTGSIFTSTCVGLRHLCCAVKVKRLLWPSHKYIIYRFWKILRKTVASVQT
jgi:hypothetical protein